MVTIETWSIGPGRAPEGHFPGDYSAAAAARACVESANQPLDAALVESVTGSQK
jgi:hypothetical protein